MISLHEITCNAYFAAFLVGKPVSCCKQKKITLLGHNIQLIIFIFNVNVKLIMLLKHLCETNYVAAHVKQLLPTYIN